ncbi:MAG: hypothetical protein BRC57_09745 [Cyanobacteria bacterium QS_8_48_54]|nr:MAG: hypothetical protein BRC57_09745 [Cyanobacteria bacterium QS_8_48_54]
MIRERPVRIAMIGSTLLEKDCQMKQTRINSITLLEDFIKDHPSGKELKRALAVKLALENYSYRDIQSILNVSLGFITKWKHYFQTDGVEGLQSRHRGSQGYLSLEQKRKIVSWISQQGSLNVEQLEFHIAKFYDVVFRSKPSYYDLLKEAGMSWHKSKKKDKLLSSGWKRSEPKLKRS